MFRKREPKTEHIVLNNYEKHPLTDAGRQKMNTILKGSKLTGDINISCDLELSGEVEGNITSDENSNIVIKGVCRGNIKTSGGSVEIGGELSDGDITAGGDVKVTGKFKGGMVKARGKIYLNGEFTGKIEGNEIDLGPDARGSGELLYREYISISRGAQVDASISQIQERSVDAGKPHDAKVINIELPIKEVSRTQ